MACEGMYTNKNNVPLKSSRWGEVSFGHLYAIVEVSKAKKRQLNFKSPKEFHFYRHLLVEKGSSFFVSVNWIFSSLIVTPTTLVFCVRCATRVSGIRPKHLIMNSALKFHFRPNIITTTTTRFLLFFSFFFTEANSAAAMQMTLVWGVVK